MKQKPMFIGKFSMRIADSCSIS